jgi:beta-1,2-xylosyltransferase
MAFNLPFSMPATNGLPIPRRFVILFLSLAILILFLHTFAPTTLPPALTPHIAHHEPDASLFSPSKWLPPILNPNVPDHPVEFDEDGNCLFLSPFGALSPQEKARAASLNLQQVSPGVVQSRPLPKATDADPDWDDEFEIGGSGNANANGTSSTPKYQGLTHPILGLLRDGEVKWNDMLARQSKTLEQAVEVYKEKWGRNPPKGFDQWWQFAQSRDVLLPDEYDA